MTEHSYIELLSNRLKTRGVVEDAGSGAMTEIQLARSGFSGRPIGDRYSPTSRIGRGRLGEIYEALDAAGRDVGVERRVALQRIDDRIVAEQRFVAELERGYAVLRAGAHPNVVKTLDFFRDGNGYFLVMELLEGLSLRSVLDDAAPEALSLEETASIVRAVGDGLQYLHAKSMVHGDLRPANVFITFDYVVKLLDVAPMSPLLGVPYRVEDAEHGPRSRDVRDDVYELACLTYQLLSGRHPFNANSPHEAHRAGLVATPPPHLTVRQWQAIARGLALQRAQRTPSIAEFLSEFGISGTERLRAPDDPVDVPRSQPDVVPLHAVPPASPTIRPAARDVAAPIRAPAARRAIGADREPRRVTQRRTTGARLGIVFLIIVLGGTGALVGLNYEAVRARTSELMATIGAASAPQQSPPSAQTASGAESGASGLPISQAEPDSPAAAPAADAEPNAVPAAEQSPSAEAPLPVETVERNVVIAAEDPPAPVSAPAGRSDRSIASSSRPAFRFTQPVITIRENQAAAAVVIERSAASAPAAIVWWTSDNSAVADEDYADLGQRTERFAAGEQSRTIFVPLFVDSLPERTESFYIYLGRYDAARSHLATISSVRVDIRDDD
jgi:hypothetical protein